MADQPKKKPITSKTTNSDRRNGKAWKTSPSAHFRPGKAYRGSHTTPGAKMSEVEKALLGPNKGMLRNAARRARAAQG